MGYLLLKLFYAIPIAALVFFLDCLWRFLSVRKKNGAVRVRKNLLIVSSIVLGVVVAVWGVFIFLFLRALRYM